MTQSCSICGGTGFVKIKEGKGVELCSCRFSSEDVSRFLRIPKRFKDASLENFQERTTSHKNALLKVQAFLAGFDPEEGRGLTIVGPPGVGKTHLVVAVLKELYLSKRVRGLFFDTKDLLFTVKSHFDSGKYSKILKVVLNVPVLALDDLGSERLSDWQREVISLIITHRYNNLKSTLITTNYPIKVKGKSGEDIKVGDSLEERLGPSVVSRLTQMNITIFLKGEDLRQSEETQKTVFKNNP